MPGRAGAVADARVEAVLARHRPELVRFCDRRLGSATEAEDAAQETLARAWLAYDRFEGRASVRSWLFRIASNVCADSCSSRARRAVPLAPDDPAVVHEPLALGDGARAARDPAEIVAVRERAREAHAVALRRLPPRQRAALLLCDIHRLEAREAADVLGTTVPAVTSALQRARATLRVSPR